MDRGWPEMLPVELNMPFEVQQCKPAVRFGTVNPALGVKSPPWEAAPVVLYRHMVKAKPGAIVLLSGEGGEPLLVAGSYGKGRVVVFTGTVLGQPADGQIPFWKSNAWPEILSAAIKWSRKA
jgi:uncharacterized membrane protein